MKHLFILRHAKSSWQDSSLADFQRPLNARGRRAAGLMGRFIKKERLKPDLVLSSPAVRARDTIRIVLESAGLAVAVRYEPDIYLASCARLLEVVSQIENDRHRVVVVGHNPGMEELIHRLTGVARPMPTAALANVALDVQQWTEVSARNCGHLEWLVSPKQLEILSLMPKRERS